MAFGLAKRLRAINAAAAAPNSKTIGGAGTGAGGPPLEPVLPEDELELELELLLDDDELPDDEPLLPVDPDPVLPLEPVDPFELDVLLLPLLDQPPFEFQPPLDDQPLLLEPFWF